MNGDNNVGLLDHFEKITMWLTIGVYLMLGVSLLVHGLFGLGKANIDMVMMPLVGWFVIGVILVVAWTKVESIRFGIALLVICFGGLLLFGAVKQVGVDIANSKPPDEYYQYPADGTTAEQEDWNREKYVFDPNKGPGVVLAAGYLATVMGYGIMLWTQKKVSVQWGFAIAWGVFALSGLLIPQVYPDEATYNAAGQLWWWGASQSVIWLIGNHLLNYGIKAVSQVQVHPMVDTLSAALTWGITEVIFTVITPAVVTLYLVTNNAHGSSLSVNMAMSIMWSGQLTFIAFNGVFTSLKNAFTKWLI